MLIIGIANTFILWLFTKLNKISKESSLYKRLNIFLVIVPLIIIYIYFLYLLTDTHIDWIIASILALIIMSIISIYEKKVKNDKYINSIMVITTMILNFILFNIIILFILSPNIRTFLYVILFSISGITSRSKNNDGKVKYVATITVILLIVISLITKNHMGIQIKPERIADDYIIEKGYDLDEIDHKNIDYFKIKNEPINITYITRVKNNRKFGKMISMKYYKGKIIDFKVD
ncbi:hypothetical protein [Senegalia massiliensis]|uniref:Uncharacterized protein n=1 Tax=Senegalia massiliensis TaxID=1720316 RepID=A0A845QWN9_9CLOT|nr:hypothetical protein [Senegalia massiliensis]NBI06199.1 hypothetical protein [Senegalia massiliensis]